MNNLASLSFLPLSACLAPLAEPAGSQRAGNRVRQETRVLEGKRPLYQVHYWEATLSGRPSCLGGPLDHSIPANSGVPPPCSQCFMTGSVWGVREGALRTRMDVSFYISLVARLPSIVGNGLHIFTFFYLR